LIFEVNYGLIHPQQQNTAAMGDRDRPTTDTHMQQARLGKHKAPQAVAA
jgi:hypothetical protein